MCYFVPPTFLTILKLLKCWLYLWVDGSFLGRFWKVFSSIFPNIADMRVRQLHTVWNIHFCQKIQLLFPEKNCQIVLGENSWKCRGFGLFSCWQLWFHEKNCQKNFERKTRENVGDLHFLFVDMTTLISRENCKILSKLNFCTKIWLFE